MRETENYKTGARNSTQTVETKGPHKRTSPQKKKKVTPCGNDVLSQDIQCFPKENKIKKHCG